MPLGLIQICELPRSHTNCRGCITTCLAVENSAGPETHVLGFDGGVGKHGGSDNEELATKVQQTLVGVLGRKTQNSMLSDISNQVWVEEGNFMSLAPIQEGTLAIFGGEVVIARGDDIVRRGHGVHSESNGSFDQHKEIEDGA
jgi:hypothetical protein